MVLAMLTTTSCGFSTFAPTLGGGLGAGVGSIGGPAGAVGGGLAGAALGQIYKESKHNGHIPSVETLKALSEGDVKKLLELKLQSHQSGFEDFTSNIKKILTVAACFLGLYLLVPIFVARNCSKAEAVKNLTRIPFPNKTTGKDR